VIMICALQRCLSWIVAEEERDDREGDLDEAYARDAVLFGEHVAWRRRRRHILSYILSIAHRRSGAFLQERPLPATAATLIALTGYASLSRVTAETWWIKSGFERNPGFFVSENEIDYPVCEIQGQEEPGSHVTKAWSHVVLLPRSARIAKVYCGAPGERIRLSDDNYTMGRVLTAQVGLRVVWKD